MCVSVIFTRECGCVHVTTSVQRLHSHLFTTVNGYIHTHLQHWKSCGMQEHKIGQFTCTLSLCWMSLTQPRSSCSLQVGRAHASSCQAEVKIRLFHSKFSFYATGDCPVHETLQKKALCCTLALVPTISTVLLPIAQNEFGMKIIYEVPWVHWQERGRCFVHADAPEPMTEFDPSKTYVIGGIVDRTVRKGVTATYAVRLEYIAQSLQ